MLLKTEHLYSARRFSFRAKWRTISKNIQIYSPGMQMKCFFINFTVSELLGIPVCPWKNELQSQPETHCENICKCVQRNLAPLGKPPPHQNEALLFVDFETWQFRKKQAGVSKAPVGQRQPPLCGSLSPLCVFLSIWFWPLFTVSIISIPARRLGEAKRDDIIIFPYFFFSWWCLW